jgi:hypothetical protein
VETRPWPGVHNATVSRSFGRLSSTGPIVVFTATGGCQPFARAGRVLVAVALVAAPAEEGVDLL